MPNVRAVIATVGLSFVCGLQAEPPRDRSGDAPFTGSAGEAEAQQRMPASGWLEEACRAAQMECQTQKQPAPRHRELPVKGEPSARGKILLETKEQTEARKAGTALRPEHWEYRTPHPYVNPAWQLSGRLKRGPVTMWEEDFERFTVDVMAYLERETREAERRYRDADERLERQLDRLERSLERERRADEAAQRPLQDALPDLDESNRRLDALTPPAAPQPREAWSPWRDEFRGPSYETRCSQLGPENIVCDTRERRW